MKHHGFTLLETIVALILITTVGVALLNWLNNMLGTLQRVQQVQQSNEAIHSALSFMQTVNPWENPKGEKTIGAYRFSWQTKIVVPPKDGVSTLGFASLYQLALYDTEVMVRFTQGNTLISRFTMRQVGYKQVYQPPQEN